jgi:hypothetical protein
MMVPSSGFAFRRTVPILLENDQGFRLLHSDAAEQGCPYPGLASRNQVRWFRLHVERHGNRVRLINRNGYDWTKRYPWIVEAALKTARSDS